jgi:hypothetical protein
VCPTLCVAFDRARMTGTEVYADEAGAWNELHGGFAIHRINHQEAYSLDGDISIPTTPSRSSRACAQIGFYSAKIVASALKIIA